MDSTFGSAALADVLRRRQSMSASGAASGVGGGTVGRPSPFGGGVSSPTVERQNQGPLLSQSSTDNLMKGLKGFLEGGGSGGAGIGEAAQYYGPEVAKMGGTVSGAPSAGAAGAGPWGAMLAAALASYGLDNEMKDKDSAIHGDKLNKIGTVGGDKRIGFRTGDIVNAMNPATYLRNPKEGLQALGNALTLGIFD